MSEETKKAHVVKSADNIRLLIEQMQVTYDENGYGLPLDIKLQRVDQHVKATIGIYSNRVKEFTQQTDRLQSRIDELEKEKANWHNREAELLDYISAGKEMLTEKDIHLHNNKFILNEYKTLIASLEQQLLIAGDSKYKELYLLALEIDFMGTKEFCEYSGIDTPQYRGSVVQSANDFLRVDAIRYKKLIDKAKQIRDFIPVPPTENIKDKG